MRFFISIGFIFISLVPARADDYQLQMPPTQVEVFQQSAMVTRQGQLTLEPGRHRVMVPISDWLEDGFLSFSTTSGARITSFQIVDNLDFEPLDFLTDDQAIAHEEVEKLESRVDLKTQDVDKTKARIAAFDAQSAFLSSVTGGGDAALDPQAVISLGQAIRDEFETAQNTRAAETANMQMLVEELDDLNRDLAVAERRLSELNLPGEKSAGLIIDVNVSEPGDVGLEFRHITDAGWGLFYEITLGEGGAPEIQIDRKVIITNQSETNWHDVTLILSTADIGQVEPSTVRGSFARIEEPEPLVPQSRADSISTFGGTIDPVVIEPAVIVEEAASMFSIGAAGGSVLAYQSPETASILAGEQAVFNLDVLRLAADLSYVAVPRRDDFAYVVANVTNTSEERISPATATLFSGNRLVGTTETPLIPAGASAELGFGPEESILTSYAVLDRETGDSGLVNVTSTRDDIVKLTVENLGAETREIRVLHGMPYSEQEDLRVTTRTSIEPEERNVDDKTGVAAWTLQLDAGEIGEIQLDHTLSWPDGQVLRWFP